MDTIVLVGYGNIAGAIAKGLDSLYKLQICGRDIHKVKECISANQLQNATSIDSTPIDIQDKILILAIKPYGLASFRYQGIAKSVYFVLAGVDIRTIKQHVSAESYIRVMPNIGAAFRLSSTAAFIEGSANANMTEIKKQAKEILESFGNVVFVDNENLIDSAIATSGSSPAFLALIAQALIDAGVREGFKRKDSAILVQKTFEGIAKLLEHYSPDEIISLITTPAGTTIEGLSILESKAVRGAIIEACHTSVQKAKH